MAFQKYSNTNYAKGTLNAAIDASSTSLVLDAGQGGRFPDTPTENSFFLRIYQFSDDTQTFIARQEIIKCNARVSDILSIDRGADYITADSDANTQTNTAFAFDPNNGTVFVDQVVCNAQVEDIQDEIERLETEKVSIVALQDNTHLYGESSTGTDAYALSLTPTLTAYVDGQIFSFKADVENVGPCTINVDGLGALDVKKRGNIDLETGDIKADQDVLFQVDGRNAQMLSQTGSVSAGGSPQVVSICTAGEDITGSDNEGICFMGTGEQDVASATSNTATLFGDLAASEKVRVVLDPSSFNSSVLRNLTLELGKVGAPADGINVNFFATVDAAEVPAFSDNQLFIDESEIPWPLSTITKDFVMAHIPEGATEFIIELERTGALDPANYYTWGRDSGSSLSISSDLYVNSVWTAQTGTFYYDMTLGFENDKLYLSDNRYAEMSDCEYIAKNSVLQDAESEFVIYGQKTQTSSIGDEFYLNAAIAGPTEDNLTDQTQFTGDNSYQDIFDVDTSTLQGYYLKTIDLDLRNTTSAVGDVWLKVETITPLSVDRVTLYETPYIDASTIGSGLPHTRVPFDFQNFVFPNEDVRISLEKSFGANLPIDLIEPVSTSFLSTVTTDQPLNAISRLPVIDFVYSNDVDVQRGRYTTDKPQGKSSLTEVIQNSNLYKGIVKKIGQSFKDNTMTFSSPEQHGGAINYQYKCDPYGTVESFSLSTTTNTSLLESLSQVFTAEESGYLCYTHLSDFTDTDTAVDMALTLTIVNDCGVSIVGSVIDHFHNNISWSFYTVTNYIEVKKGVSYTITITNDVNHSGPGDSTGAQSVTYQLVR